MTALRDKLENFGLPAHAFRVVRIIDDEDHAAVIAYAEDTFLEPGQASLYILDSYASHERSRGEMGGLVADLNDYITAHRRLVGLDTDVFARNGIA